MYGKVRKVSIIEYGILAICVRISNIPIHKSNRTTSRKLGISEYIIIYLYDHERITSRKSGSKQVIPELAGRSSMSGAWRKRSGYRAVMPRNLRMVSGANEAGKRGPRACACWPRCGGRVTTCLAASVPRDPAAASDPARAQEPKRKAASRKWYEILYTVRQYEYCIRVHTVQCTVYTSQIVECNIRAYVLYSYSTIKLRVHLMMHERLETPGGGEKNGDNSPRKKCTYRRVFPRLAHLLVLHSQIKTYFRDFLIKRKKEIRVRAFSPLHS